MKIKKIKGLIAAPFTPMKPDGEINPAIIPEYAEKLKSSGVKGVFICGTTGEGMLMTLEERKIITEEWVGEQTNDFKVIVHVGTTSAKQSKELAEHAQSFGAYGIGCMGPVFLKPGRTEELIDFCAEVAAGAPDLPFYYYHIPSVSGVTLSMVEFLQKAAPVIPNLAGIKFTHNNFMEMQQCLQHDEEKWDILSGFDEMLLAGLAFGAKGAVGSTFNFMAPIYNQIIEDFENGNIEAARIKQIKTVNIVEILVKHNGAIVAGKSLMKSVGIDCGKCRAPLRNLKESEHKNLKRELEKEGVFDKETQL
ncbi:dihydrodipicolinate synthase family protein [Maribellus maritimus]|uniref:dihydrodipicolinate synthase family protein n=1 Tax=Maribellus maritimus TaxID=2870838 RepID=UPI001EEC908F|nr:dihydrodipicolinate synthase family protein [Maribellus maritimus]MCG6190640.1 dihydrodipicolinate synthase family protein [Maribellus maritimus]